MFTVVAAPSGLDKTGSGPNDDGVRPLQSAKDEWSELHGAHGSPVLSSGALKILGRGRPIVDGVPHDLSRLRSSAVLEAAAELNHNPLSYLARTSGSFAFVVLDSARRRLTAVTDPFSTVPLYRRFGRRGDELWISDRVDALGSTAGCDPEFIRDFVLTGRSACRTLRSDVQRVPPATILTWDRQGFKEERYWFPERQPILRIGADEASGEYRRLLEEAVLLSMDAGGSTWCDLSGGLDSSSIAAVAGHLFQSGRTDRPLGGTLTFDESLRNGDDRALQDAVVGQYQLRNRRIVDFWPWRRDGQPPPRSDQPARDFPFFARNRVASTAMRVCGGTSLLTGDGPDHCLPGVPLHIPDLMWRGRVVTACRETFKWASGFGRPFVKSLMREAIMPLAPLAVRRREVSRGVTVPGWLRPEFAGKTGYRDAAVELRLGNRRRGSYYKDGSWTALASLAASVGMWSSLRGDDVRHPFLHRPLVEFSLQLPQPLRTDVDWTKPTLRNAMRGILPESVRSRSTKGDIVSAISRAFHEERDFFVYLLSEPVLADLGCVEPRLLLQAVDDFSRRGIGRAAALLATLALETWLSTESGRCNGLYAKVS